MNLNRTGDPSASQEPREKERQRERFPLYSVRKTIVIKERDARSRKSGRGRKEGRVMPSFSSLSPLMAKEEKDDAFNQKKMKERNHEERKTTGDEGEKKERRQETPCESVSVSTFIHSSLFVLSSSLFFPSSSSSSSSASFIACCCCLSSAKSLATSLTWLLSLSPSLRFHHRLHPDLLPLRLSLTVAHSTLFSSHIRRVVLVE